MGLLTWLIVGAIVGWLAALVIKGKGFGLIGNVLVGVIGALTGGWLAGTLLNAQNPISGFNLNTFIVAFFGAVLVLYVARHNKNKGWFSDDTPLSRNTPWN